MKLVDFKFTSDVKKRKPVDTLSHGEAAQKVWAYLTMKNVSGQERCVTVTFRFNGKKRSRVTLDIGESPTWRTWAYNTVQKKDVPGKIEVRIVDDQGVELLKQNLPLQAPG